MKLLTDENVSHRIVRRLLNDGHTVIFAQDVALEKRDEACRWPPLMLQVPLRITPYQR